MLLSRFLIRFILVLAAVALPQRVAAMATDSIYASPDLRASSAPPWSPPAPVPAARPWDTLLRFPGRIVSLPLVVMGNAAERAMIYVEEADVVERVLILMARSQKLGIEVVPASLGEHSGVGGELRWAPPGIDRRVLLEAGATMSQYNRERITGSIGPFNAVYASEWRPRDLFYGAGLTAPHSGESAFGGRSESAQLILAWGWQSFDTVNTQPTEAQMLRDRVHVRGPRHRTWVSAWAGPREASITRGRDPSTRSFEIAHPAEAAGSLYRGVEHLVYGAGLSLDARSGRPHWSNGWRASFEAERYDKPVRALALHDARGGARSFNRLTYRAEGGASFGRDSRTLRLALKAVDQQPDVAGDTFLISDLQSLGGGAGLAGFESGRFRDLDLMVAKLSYIFPLVKNFEFDLHTETGGVYPDLTRARIKTFESSFGAALRFRTEFAPFGALGCDWSAEETRIWFSLGGIE